MFKNKKNIFFITLSALIIIVVSVLIELFVFNFKALVNESNNNPKIIEMHDIEKKDGYYVTKSKNAYIILDGQDKYFNYLSFNYVSDDIFKWSISYDDEKLEQNSSNLINKAYRTFKNDAKEIKISFESKDIKVKDFTFDNDIHINLTRIISIIICGLLFVVIIKYRKYWFKNIEKAFLFIALPIGFLYILISPNHMVTYYDDETHIKKVFTLFSSKDVEYTEAMTLTQDRYIYNNSSCFQTNVEKEAYYDTINYLHKGEAKPRVDVSGGISYNKIIYIPFSIGWNLGNLLHLNFTHSLMLSKMFNLFAYVFLLYFAVKLCPSYARKIVFIIALLASNVFCATQFNYDTTIRASLILAIVMFLKMLESENIKKKDLLIFIGCVIWGSLPKAIYAPMLFLLLFLSNDKFQSKKQAYVVKISVIVGALLLLSTFVLPTLIGTAEGDSRGGDTSVSRQLAYILSNPIGYAELLVNFFFARPGSNIFNVLNFYDFQYILGNTAYYYIPYIVSLICLLYFNFTVPVNKEKLSNKMKVVFGIMIFGIWLLICSALYLCFTEVGNFTIEGVQPRYFIPLLLPLLLILKPTTVKKKIEDKDNIWLLLVPFLVLCFSIACLIIKIYGF